MTTTILKKRMPIVRNKITSKKQVENIIWGIGVDSMNRFEVFLKIANRLPPNLFWYALNLAYTGSDNLFQHKLLVRKAFSSKRAQRECLMSDHGFETFKALPKTVTIYRGMTLEEKKSGNFGVSWTLDKKVALFFKKKYQRNYSTSVMEKIVLKLEVPKEKIIAYFNDRKENEVIYLG